MNLLRLLQQPLHTADVPSLLLLPELHLHASSPPSVLLAGSDITCAQSVESDHRRGAGATAPSSVKMWCCKLPKQKQKHIELGSDVWTNIFRAAFTADVLSKNYKLLLLTTAPVVSSCYSLQCLVLLHIYVSSI